MPPIFEALERYFAEGNPDVRRVGDEPVLRFEVEAAHGSWTCFAQAREAERQFLFYGVCPETVPPAKRAAVAEFLTRANFGLAMGNFEQDWEGGAVRFKTGVDVEGDELSRALIENVVHANIVAMDRYLPGLRAVLASGLAPATLIAEIEALAADGA